LSRHNISRSKQTTRRAEVFSVGENFPHRFAADACLTGAARVYLYQSAPSIFGFVRNLTDKGSPRSILYRLSEHATRQAFDLQVFHNNRSEILNQAEVYENGGCMSVVEKAAGGGARVADCVIAAE
jgi:hypothetical protein